MMGRAARRARMYEYDIAAAAEIEVWPALEQLRLSFSRSCNCVHDEPLGGSAGAGIGGVEQLANAA